MGHEWLEFAKRLQAIAQAGMTYTTSPFELERYEEVRAISIEMMAAYTHTPLEAIPELFAGETGYQTPKVDIRAVIFRDDKILMVQEQVDQCWSLPGGWADIGYSPAEMAVKEAQEEAGITVRPVRLLGIVDKRKHPHPPGPYHIYKMFILCEIAAGEPCPDGKETIGVGYFGRDELPPLSIKRITHSQLELLFSFLDDPAREPLFD